MLLMLATGGQSPSPPPIGPLRNLATMMTTTDRPGTVDSGGVTIGTAHKVMSAVTNPVLRWVVSRPSLGGTVSTETTIRAAIRVGSGAFVPVTFSGLDDATLPIAAVGEVTVIESDPIPVTIPAGSDVTINVWGKPDGPGLSQVSQDMWIGGIDPGYITGGASTVTGSTYATGVARSSLRPTGLIGNTESESWVLTGDSITQQSYCHLERWARTAGKPAAKSAQGGEGWYHFPASFPVRLGSVLSHATHVLSALGVNDVYRSASVAMQDALDYWNQIRAVETVEHLVACTLTPCFVTSTDGYTTLEGQTPPTSNRAEVNAWLRDGAPISGGAPAPGNPLALRIGDPGHPVDQLADISSAIQDTGDTGRFRVDLGSLGGDGTHFNSTAHSLIADYLATIL